MQIQSSSYRTIQHSAYFQGGNNLSNGQADSAIQDRMTFTQGSSSTNPSGPAQSGARNGAAAPAATVKGNSKYFDVNADKNAVAAYYGDIQKLESESPTELYSSLHDLVTNTHKPLPYGPEKYLYHEVDRHPDGNIYCLYSGGGPMFDGDHSSNIAPIKNGNYNCEHVVPQSWFHKESTPRGDLHHLYAAQVDCNSHRGNALYAELKGHDSGDYHWDDGIVDQSKNLFEPTAGKGEAARAVLYFLLRYPDKIGDEKNEYTVKDIPMLKEWAEKEPPTEYEKHRNDTIQGLQGNRNPLIDFPELVEKVDFTQGLGALGKAAV